MADPAGTPAGAKNKTMPASRTPMPFRLTGSNVSRATIGAATPYTAHGTFSPIAKPSNPT